MEWFDSKEDCAKLNLGICLFSEYAENIGDGKSEEFKESEQKRIMDLLENF